MREYKLEEVSPIEAIKVKLWKVFDTLRSEGISSEDYHVLLFLLSVYKDGLLSVDIVNPKSHLQFTDSNNLYKKLVTGLHNSDSELANQYVSILSSFEPIITRLSDSGIGHIIRILWDLDMKILDEYFPEVFDSVLYRIAESHGRPVGEFMQPAELTRFICNMAELPASSRVYNPFAGLASFDVYLGQGNYYFGQERNQKAHAIGVLRIMAYKKNGTSRYACEDSINNWPAKSEKFNLIVSNPPFGLHINNRYQELGNKFKGVEQFILQKGVDSLSDDGKLIAVLPNSCLYKAGKLHEVRAKLIESDLVEYIIGFPGGLLLNTGMPFIVLVINKCKKMPGYVTFIDAIKFVQKKGLRGRELNDFALLGIINNHQESDSVKIVPNGKLKEYGYNLSVPKFFLKEVEGIQIGKLLEYFRPKELLEYFKYSGESGRKYGKLLKVSHLKENGLNPYLDLSLINENEINSKGLRVIDEDCLLISKIGNKLKPSLFKYRGEPLFISSDINSFKIKHDLVNDIYFVNELNAEYVTEQISSNEIGTTISRIRTSDLLNIKIKLIPINEQIAKAQALSELYYKVRLLEQERNTLAHGISNTLHESISSIKHALGKPLLNIGSSLRNIEKSLSRLIDDWELIKLNERYDSTLKDSFDSVYNNLRLIHSILLNNESELDFGNYDLHEIDFLEFILGYVKRIKTTEKSNVILNLDIHPDFKSQFNNKAIINANSELLEIGLNAIVENANMHAFIDNSKQYKLEFRIGIFITPSMKMTTNEKIGRFDTYIKVEVANNGKPFPKNYTLEKLVRKNSFAGETGHTGQGGFDLNEVIKFHNQGLSTLDLIIDDFTSEYTTTYSFLLPLNR
jgi:type I restriction enzyme M protein